MVGNQFMSDIIFITEDEFKIYAHSLVLHVQCPNILDDIVVEESFSNNSKRMVMWLEYSYESCLAFLEYIYSGQESFVHPEYREGYLHLRRRYNIPMVDVDDENHGSFSETQNYVSKRQCAELYNSQTDSKRFKASSPDMFTSNDSNFNFLGPIVNDEQTLSSVKTKLWLNSCNGNQTYPSSSFTRDPNTDVPLSTTLLDANSNHSFHSASTIWLETKTQNISDNSDDNIEFDNTHINSSLRNSTNESTVKTIKTKSVPCSVITRTGMTPLKKSCVLSDIIIISDSESENEKKNKSMSTIDENRTFEEYNLPFNSNNINANELNDDSVDSIYSASTNILSQRNDIEESHHSILKDPPALDPRNRSFINIDDGGSLFSTVTNVLPSIKNVRTIDKVEGGNVLNPTTYSLNNYQQGGKNGSDYGDLNDFARNTICKDKNVKSNLNNKSSTFVNTNICNVNDNELAILNCNSTSRSNSSEIFTTKRNDLNKPNMNSNQLKNTITSTNLSLPFNNSYSSSVNTNNFKDLSSQFMNNHTTVNTTSTEGTSIQSSNLMNISSIPNENDYTQHKSAEIMLLENDWISDNSDILFVPTKNNSVLDETKVQSPKHNYTYDNAINLDLKTPTTKKDYNLKNSGKKNAVTPNKYGCRENTPKSLRRVQSESVIESNDPVTPLPDYSAMKTPDFKVNIKIFIYFLIPIFYCVDTYSMSPNKHIILIIM